MPTPERALGDELSRLVAGLARKFVQRWDCYPMQLPDGRYVCVKKPLTTALLLGHLKGELTLGAYVLNSKSEVRFIVLDADDDSQFSQLQEAARQLANEEAPGYLEKSRRGGHLWFFFPQLVSGQEARAFGKGIIAAQKLEGVELYPKQERSVSGPGSLIRLPFGVHQKTGRRYSFIRKDGIPLAPTIREQVRILAAPATVSEHARKAHEIVSKGPSFHKMGKVPPSDAETVSRRIKESISVLEYVSQFVDLDEQGIGQCPFHDDEHPSFGVNDKRNYWHCFAGCGGGSIIDFWSKWREKHGEDPGFVPTITELAEMLF